MHYTVQWYLYALYCTVVPVNVGNGKHLHNAHIAHFQSSPLVHELTFKNRNFDNQNTLGASRVHRVSILTNCVAT